MNRILSVFATFLVLTAALVAQEDAAKPQIVKFTAKSLVAGDTLIRGATSGTDMTMVMSMGEMGENEMRQKSDLKETKTITILETKGKEVTKFKVKYKEVKIQTSAESPMLPEPMVDDPAAAFELSDKTFIFTLADGSVDVKTEEGETLADEKAKFLKATEAADGKFAGWNPNPAELFVKREFTVGETVLVSGDRVKSMIPTSDMLRDGLKMKVEATLTGTKKLFGVSCGVFDIVMNLEGEPKMPNGADVGMDATMKMKMSGTMTVGLNNMWLYAFTVEGPMSVDASGEVQEIVLTVEGKGTVKANILNIYSKTKLEAAK